VHRAIFLDRDGTVNEDAGYICTPDKLVFIPGAIEALRLLQKRFLLFIVTNQSGIGRRIFSEKAFVRFTAYFKSLLAGNGVDIQHTYYCPHTKQEGCRCHKPKPYFLKEAARRFNIDLRRSYVIGCPQIERPRYSFFSLLFIKRSAF